MHDERKRRYDGLGDWLSYAAAEDERKIINIRVGYLNICQPYIGYGRAIHQ